MRITEQMNINTLINQINQNQDKIASLEQKSSTGKAFQYFSDDPATASLALNLHTSIQISQSYMDTANLADEWMSANSNSLSQLSDLATKASNLAQSGLSDTNGADQRSAFATQIDGILHNALDVANTYDSGRYIFGGFQVSKQPYVAQDAGGTDISSGATTTIESVAYRGDTGVINRSIGPDQTATVNINDSANFGLFFKSLIDARNALNANDKTALQTALTDMNTSATAIRTDATVNGSRQNTVENSITQLTSTQSTIKALLSKKEDANVAEAATMLENQQSAYQISLEVGQRAISALSLFDYLK